MHLSYRPASPLPLIATCSLGLEEILAEEIRGLGLAPSVEKNRGGVGFSGDWAAVIRANVWLRTANRVVLELARFKAVDGDALANAGRFLAKGPLKDWLRPERSLSIVATSSRSTIRDTRWAALRMKDGLVDGQRERWGTRSTVLREAPDLPFRLRLLDDEATLLLDTTGEPLDHRGYRRETVTAPVRETLAAACVLASGWDGCGPVVDPMCGSGTLLIEAAWLARGWAPSRFRGGKDRSAFAFEGWGVTSPASVADARHEAPPEALGEGTRGPLVGRDIDPQAIPIARRCLEVAGLGSSHADGIDLSVGDAAEIEPPPGPGLVLVNPPYGERLEADRPMWRALGDLLKQSFRGYRAVVLAGGEGLGKEIGLKPRRKIPVWNGPLEARILLFDLY
jgi:putative N6-adenine-specific DNA methylase